MTKRNKLLIFVLAIGVLGAIQKLNHDFSESIVRSSSIQRIKLGQLKKK